MSELCSALVDELVDDLTLEIKPFDVNFNGDLLESKVKGAVREIIRARRYPVGYSDEKIERDVDQFYSNIKNIALYDYNQVGAEGQHSSTENDTVRIFVDRSSLFSGVLPFANL